MSESPLERLNKEKVSGGLSWMPWIAGGVAAALVLIYLIVFRTLPANERPDAWGQFGDYMGGLLNPLISLFTLTVAVSVWRLQRKALDIQKQELAETREAIEQQTFDQFFMSMLTSHRSMVEQVSFVHSNSGDTLQTGKRAVDSYFKQLRETAESFSAGYAIPEKAITTDTFQISGLNVFKFPDPGVLKLFAAFCVRYYRKDLRITSPAKTVEFTNTLLSYEQVFGHLFRSTYQILKIIEEQFDTDALSKDQLRYDEYHKLKRRYVNLLRAQMSESEFVFFALSALTKDGKKSWARSIQLNFFEDRLQNLQWTQKLAESFAVSKENLDEAKQILKDE